MREQAGATRKSKRLILGRTEINKYQAPERIQRIKGMTNLEKKMQLQVIIGQKIEEL